MKTSHVIHKLIRACVDDERTLRNESRFVDPTRAATLMQLAAEREHFVADLERFEGAPASRVGSMAELSREAGRDVWVAAAGRNSGDAIASCRHSRARTEAVYERALEEYLPDEILDVLTEQRGRLHDEIAVLDQLQG
jgi:hypothetical protein